MERELGESGHKILQTMELTQMAIHYLSPHLLQVQGLSDELAKQLWMVLQRSMVTVRRDPTMLVSVVRIIEREEKIDRRMVDRNKQSGFIPPGRPKRWKDKMFEVLETN